MKNCPSASSASASSPSASIGLANFKPKRGVEMKNLSFCVLAVALFACVSPFRQDSANDDVKGKIRNAGPTVDSVRQMSDLASLRVHVSDVFTAEQRGWFTGYKGAWIIKGEGVYTTDLTAAEIRTNESARVVTIKVPMPHVKWARIDHSKTKTHDLRKNATFPIWGASEKVRDQVMLNAQNLIEAAASHADYQEQAKRQVECVLREFLHSIGYELNLQWKSDAG